MHRTDAPNNQAGQFVDRDVIGGIPGTVVDDDWLNAVQEELAAVIEGSGIALAKGTHTQLRDAIKRLFGGAVTSVDFAQSPKALTIGDAGLVLVDATAGAVVINLPAANALAGVRFHFLRVDASGNTVTVNRAGADTIFAAATSFTLTGQRDSRTLVSDGIGVWYSQAPKAEANGYASLDAAGIVPDGQLPAAIHGVGLADSAVAPQLANNAFNNAAAATGYPAGISYMTVSAGNGWPADAAGLVVTVIRDPAGGRVLQWFSDTAGALYTRQWGGAAWTAWIDYANAGNLTSGTIPAARIGNDAIVTAKLAALAVTNEKLGAGAVTTSRIADGNVLAQHIGDANIFTNHLQPSSVTYAKLATAAVGAGNLKSAEDVQGGASSTASQNFAFPSVLTFGYGLAHANTDGMAHVVPYLADVHTWAIRVFNTSGSTNRIYFRAMFMLASPPYDLGDGELNGPLVFLGLDAAGTIQFASVSASPPWVGRGPTRTVPEWWDKGKPRPPRPEPLPPNAKTAAKERHAKMLAEWQAWEALPAKPYRTMKARPPKPKDGNYAAWAEAFRNAEPVPTEITHAVKNADMGLIPHPFIGDLSGITVVLLDPMNPMMEQLLEIHGSGELAVLDLIHGENKTDRKGKPVIGLDGLPERDAPAIQFGNVALPRKGPPGVMVVEPRWR